VSASKQQYFIMVCKLIIVLHGSRAFLFFLFFFAYTFSAPIIKLSTLGVVLGGSLILL